MRTAWSALLALAVLLLPTSGWAASANSAKDAPQYVRFEAMIVPVLADRRAAGLMSVKLNLKVPTPEDKQRIADARIRFVNAYTQALVAFAQLRVNPRRALDIEAVTAALQQTTDAMGLDHAAEVFIVEASVRAMD